MKIGVFNRYWNTKGGGEKYTGTIIELLSREHEVDLICTEYVDLTEISDRLDLDLSRVNFVQWPPLSCAELAPFTREYELFINSTYFSTLISHARQSVYIVFFPQAVVLPLLGKTGHKLLSSFCHLIAPPTGLEPEAGFYPPESDGRCWSGAEARFFLPGKVFRNGVARIPLVPSAFSPEILSIQGNGVPINYSVDNESISIHSEIPEDMRITLRCRPVCPKTAGHGNDSRELGVCIAFPPFNAGNPKIDHLRRRLISFLARHDTSFIASYDTHIAISQYTNHWLQKRWGVTGQILTPPIDVARFQPPPGNEKQKIILSVGRFFAGGHNKKHLEMLRVFRGMYDRGEIPEGWEYHLAGSVHRNLPEHLKYFEEIQKLADGYPIRIMENLPFSDLQKEYHAASIFWHASGWGENENRHPERFEHFGMTTCEAMAAGCIPVVIAKAGQIEIVQDGINGFTFNTESELVEKTRNLILLHESNQSRVLMQDLAASVRQFDHEHFSLRLHQILDTVLAPY